MRIDACRLHAVRTAPDGGRFTILTGTYHDRQTDAWYPAECTLATAEYERQLAALREASVLDGLDPDDGALAPALFAALVAGRYGLTTVAAT